MADRQTQTRDRDRPSNRSDDGPPDDGRFAPPAIIDQPAAAPAQALVPVSGNGFQQATHITPVSGNGEVAKRLALVMKDMVRVKKTGRNQHFNYDYATIDDMRDMVRESCAEHGLVWSMTEVEVSNAQNMVVMRYQFSLYCSDGATDAAFTTVVTGMALLKTRNGAVDDKAFSKARALAWKDWAKTQFGLSTGDKAEDPDEDSFRNREEGDSRGRDDRNARDDRGQRDDRGPREERAAPRNDAPREERAAERKPSRDEVPVVPAASDPKKWTEVFVNTIWDKCQTVRIVDALMEAEKDNLRILSEEYPDLAGRITSAAEDFRRKQEDTN